MDKWMGSTSPVNFPFSVISMASASLVLVIFGCGSTWKVKANTISELKIRIRNDIAANDP